MKYFLDTEFIEGTQKKRFLGFKYPEVLKFIISILLIPLTFFGIKISYAMVIPILIMYGVACYFIDKLKFKTKNTIDLISIGIVSEDGREFYEVSKDFNLKEAWNRFQLKINKQFPLGPEENKEYWIRDNVLKPIFQEFLEKERGAIYKMNQMGIANSGEVKDKFTYRRFKKLLNCYGKSNKEIANRIVEFIYGDSDNLDGLSSLQVAKRYEINDKSLLPEFYAYFADYDWVVFCWIFGKMIDLPKGFPMYCKDLKQILDSKYMHQVNKYKGLSRKEAWIKDVKNHRNYPTQDNCHNALDDAIWNLKLYKFIKEL
jgi:hypothetical protein